MRVITLDAATWKTIDDFYAALAKALGSPAWHGNNIDAFAETIFDGGINAIDAPFHVRIVSVDRIKDVELRAHLRRFRKMIAEESAEAGVDVQFSTNASIDD